MAEATAEALPQVFVVDSQASYASLPSGKSAEWPRVSQRFLLLLVLLALLGLVVEGCFIYYLYHKIEALSLCRPVNTCNKLSSTKPPELDGSVLNLIGSNDGNEIPQLRPAEPQRRPSAHLMGSSSPVGANNVVPWVHTGGDAFTYHMGYNRSRLLVQKKGYYYLYSKVHFAPEECSAIKHKVMRDTKAYGESMELMKSNRLHCRTPRNQNSQKASGLEDLWNSFLGGIYQLQDGDEIFVILEDGKTMRHGTAENFLGAFMI